MSPDTAFLSQLVDEISSNTKIIVDYLKQNNLPQPSFDPNGPTSPIPEDEEEVSAARAAVIEATRTLHTLAVGPGETTRFLCFNELCMLGALQVLCRFEVPQNVPTDGEISYSGLASKTGLSEALLPRFVRMAAANYYFAEPRPGFVAHTAFSKILALEEGMRACVWFRHAELLPAVAKLDEMVNKYPDSAEPEDTAFAMAFGDTFFGDKEKHPDRMVKFGQFVNAFSSGSGTDSAESIAQAYPWESLPKGSLVVDVGGGVGHIAAAIAQAHPQLRFQIQDFADLADESASHWSRQGLSDRVQFTPHNFFNAQPDVAKDATVYFLRNILHDWSDLYCRRILESIVEVMGLGSRIIISDIVQPYFNSMTKMQEARSRALDLAMLSFFNAKERSYDDWERLFSSVDSRLKIVDVVGRPRM